MANKIKQNLTYILCAALGLFTFIFLAIPYVAAFAEGMGMEMTEGLSGYKVISDFGDAELGFFGTLSTILQVLVVIAGIAILAYGVLGLLGAFDVVKLGFVKKDIASKALMVYAAINVLLLISLIIVCIVNTEEVTEYGMTIKAGMKLQAGIFVTVILAAGAVVADKLLGKKFAEVEEASAEESDAE